MSPFPDEVLALLGDDAELLRERLDAQALHVEERLAARIEPLQRRAEALAEEARTAERTARTLRDQIAARDREIDELTSRLTEARARIATLDSALEEAERRLAGDGDGASDALRGALLQLLGADAPDVAVRMPLLDAVDFEPLPVFESAAPQADSGADLRVGSWSFYRPGAVVVGSHVLPETMTVPQAVAHARATVGFSAVLLWTQDVDASCLARIAEGSVYASRAHALVASLRLGVPIERVVHSDQPLGISELQGFVNEELSLREDESLADWLRRTGWEFVDNRHKKGMLRVLGPSEAFKPVARRLTSEGVHFTHSEQAGWWTRTER